MIEKNRETKERILVDTQTRMPFVIGIGCRVMLLQETGFKVRTGPYMGHYYIKSIVERDEVKDTPFQIILENEQGYVSSVDGWSRIVHVGQDHRNCKGEHKCKKMK